MLVDRFKQLLLDVVLVQDRTDNLLQEVLHGDEAGRAAVLVHDDGHLRPLAPHLPEQIIQPLALRHKVGRPHHLPRREGVMTGLDMAEQILDVHHPHNLVDRVVVHRNA